MSHLRVFGRVRALALLGALGLIVALGAVPNGAVAQESPLKQAAKGQIRAPVFTTSDGIEREAPFLSGGLLATMAGTLDEADRGEQADEASSADIAALAISQGTLGCRTRNTDGNVRVNQDCGFRRQAEALIKINPIDPRNIIAGQNDSRIGFNHCGFDFSLDGGRHWGDGLPPFWNRLNNPPAGHTIGGGTGTNRTYDAASDPALAFDSAGRAFYSCVVFDATSADNANGILVASSPAGAGGSFYNNVPAAGSQNVVVEDVKNNFSHDKEFITADAFPNSPFRDNVYVSWTLFEFEPRCVRLGNPAGQCSNRIYFSRSTDHAATWSAPMEISGSSQTLCFLGDALDPIADPHKCNLDQGSDPIVRPNGDVVVVFINRNAPANSPNSQQLAVVSHDGGKTFGEPTKVGDDVVFASFPTATNPNAPTIREPRCNVSRGREECIPGAFIRTNDFPRIAVDKSNGDLFVTWQDYRTGAFDIQLSMSKDGGQTWKSATKAINPDTTRDHYMPAIDIGSNHQVAVSYYRTERVLNENTPPLHPTGCFTTPGVAGTCFLQGDAGVQAEPSNYFLAGGRGLATPFRDVRLSPTFDAPDGNQAGFNGDYSGLAVSGNEAHPIWSDTRNTVSVLSPSQGVVHDEDVFTDRVAIPSADSGDDDRQD
jgi:hypothetical protein